MGFASRIRDLLRSRARSSKQSGAEARIEEAMQRATQLETAGKREDALHVLQQLLAAGDRSAPLLARAGVLNGQMNRLAEARELLESALRVDPAYVGALADLALVWRLSGRQDEAVHCLRRAHALAPGDSLVACNLAYCLRESGDPTGAFQLYAWTLHAEPLNPEAMRGLASLVGRLEPVESLVRVVREIAAVHPGHAAAQATLGLILLKRDFNPAGALSHFDRALALGDADVDTIFNRAIALQDLGRLEEAIEGYDRVLAMSPHSAHVRFHRALARLLQGNFESAWDDYELRNLQGDAPRKLPDCPVWDGTALGDKTLLVCAEQGIGDEIMFASCLSEAMARCGRCVIDCSPRLAGLLARSFPGLEVHAVEQRAAPQWERFAPIDFAIRAGSLPRLFRRSLQAFPRHTGYLRADPARIEAMHARLAQAGAGRKIGISWRGGTLRSRAPLRSLTLDRLLPLLRVPGIQWVSLQYDADAAEVERFAREHGVALVHWRDVIEDFEDTAALVCALDLSISVCTAIVHLCGALGRPVRVMAPFSPEWRYGARGETMPWYPSARVIRQRVPGDWSGVLETIEAELRAEGEKSTG